MVEFLTGRVIAHEILEKRADFFPSHPYDKGCGNVRCQEFSGNRSFVSVAKTNITYQDDRNIP